MADYYYCVVFVSLVSCVYYYYIIVNNVHRVIGIMSFRLLVAPHYLELFSTRCLESNVSQLVSEHERYLKRTLHCTPYEL